MKVSQATKYFFDYHAANSRKNTARSHPYVLEEFSFFPIAKNISKG